MESLNPPDGLKMERHYSLAGHMSVIAWVAFSLTLVHFARATGTPPTILKVSDAVTPGNLFTNTGVDIIQNDSLKVAIALDITNRSPHADY